MEFGGVLFKKKRKSVGKGKSVDLGKRRIIIKTSILSFISGRLATKSNQIKKLIRNGRSASLQRTFKKYFTSFSHSTRNKTRDGLIRVRNIIALKGGFHTSLVHGVNMFVFFFSSRRRHTRLVSDWSSDVCSSD